MSLISSAAMDRMRVRVEQGMKDLATITRGAGTDDGHGGTKKGAGTTVGTNIPVWFRPQRTRAIEEPVGGVESFVQLWTLHFPAGTDLRPRDIVTIGTRRFQVLEERNGSYEIDSAATAQEIT